MILGSKIKLIAFEPDHWVFISKWISDPYYRYYFRNIPELMTIQQMQAFPQVLGMNVMIILNYNNDVVGMATWDNVRILARNCCIGFLIDRDFKGLGYAKDAFMEFIYYLTHRLGIHKVIAKVAESEYETASKTVYGGFSDKNIMRDEFFIDGKWHNEVWLSVIDKEFAEKYDKFKKGEMLWVEEKVVVEAQSPIKMS